MTEWHDTALDPQLWSFPGQVLRFWAYDQTNEGWYTNPHGNEHPGGRFACLRTAKEQLGDDFHPPTIIVALRESDGKERVPGEKWAEKDTGRTVSGCLTDLEVMARMGLVQAKVVLDPSDSGPPTSSGTDIQGDLRHIISRLRPPSQDESRDAQAVDDGTTEFGQIVAILLTIEVFLPIALKRHGITPADA